MRQEWQYHQKAKPCLTKDPCSLICLGLLVNILNQPLRISDRQKRSSMNFRNLHVCRFWYYTGVTNYRCSNCLRRSIKQTILQKPINCFVQLLLLFIPSKETNDICFKIKFNLLKTLFILGYPSRYFEWLLLLVTGVYVNTSSSSSFNIVHDLL